MEFGNYSVQKFALDGPLLITSKSFGDERGFFTERYRVDEFKKMGLPSFIQDNYSRSEYGVLRGLHFQYDLALGKLVTATRGQILDVAVDIRSASSSFGKSIQVVLDGDKPQWLWVPAGFAHGFAVLSKEGADVMYKVDQLYNPRGEGAIQWNDPDLNIAWQINNPILSAKDKIAASFADYRKLPQF